MCLRGDELGDVDVGVLDGREVIGGGDAHGCGFLVPVCEG